MGFDFLVILLKKNQISGSMQLAYPTINFSVLMSRSSGKDICYKYNSNNSYNTRYRY